MLPKLHRRFINPLFLLLEEDPSNNNAARDRFNTRYLGITHSEQWVGACGPLIDTKNDLLKTFKPYKSWVNALVDISQPLRGIMNFYGGILMILLAPILGLIIAPATLRRVNVFTTLTMPGSWLLFSFGMIVRGLAQIITTPLTWFARLPLRAIITKLKGFMDVSEEAGVKALVELIKKTLQTSYQHFLYTPLTGRTYEEDDARRLCCMFSKSTMRSIDDRLLVKYERARKRGLKLPSYVPESLPDTFKLIYVSPFMNDILLNRIPASLKPYTRINRVRGLKPNQAAKLSEDLSALENNGEQSIIPVLEKFGLYNQTKLFFLSCHRKDQDKEEPTNLRHLSKDLRQHMTSYLNRSKK